MKKYEITDIAHPDNPNLHRIRAVTDLTEDVLAGMLGGYVESCDNLDQDGRAWISADAIACENAVVCGDAPNCRTASIWYWKMPWNAASTPPL